MRSGSIFALVGARSRPGYALSDPGRSCMRYHLAVVILTSMAASVRGAGLTDTPPPGPYFPLSADVHKTAETFIAGRPIVGTTYFYWYDVYSGAHLRNKDGTDALTHHPPAAA